MRKRAWGATSALCVCLAVAGCGETDDHERDELSAQDDGLRPRDGGAKAPSSSKDAGSVGNQPGSPPASCDDGGSENPCHLIDCGPGQRCELEVVQCIRAPCPPIATCVPIESVHDAGSPGCAAVLCRTGTTCKESANGPECVPIASCAATTCMTGTNCVETPTGAECVPVATCASTLCMTGTNCVDTASGAQCVPLVTCASTLCVTGTNCVDTSTGPQCVPSGVCNLACTKGTHCELEAVACFAAPCPAQPECVPDVDACATVRCKAGTHCELQEVVCIRAPCNPVAACVAD